MTCMDCISYEICRIVRSNGDDRVLENSPCKYFKNKSDFVEARTATEMVCKIKTNIIENVSAMIENDFNNIVKDALGIRRDT